MHSFFNQYDDTACLSYGNIFKNIIRMDLLQNIFSLFQWNVDARKNICVCVLMNGL